MGMHTACVDAQCVTSCDTGLSACSGGCCSVTFVATIGGMGCAIKGDGSVWCWENHDKPLALKGAYMEGSFFTAVPSNINSPIAARELALTGGRICVLGGTGDVFCEPLVAANSFVTESGPFVPWTPRSGATYQHIYGSAGLDMCGLGVDGIVDCTLGFGLADQETTMTLPGMWTSFSVGTRHECGSRADGTVECLGTDPTDSEVLGGPMSAQTPLAIPGFDDSITSVTSGDAFSCALGMRGGVECWGSNDLEDLAVGMSPEQLPSSAKPLAVKSLTSNVATIGANLWRACALTSDRRAWCWSMVYCPSPDPEAEVAEQDSPAEVTPFFGPISSIIADPYMVCAILLGGGVECIDLPEPTGSCLSQLAAYNVPGL